jgi:hypothetical protein
MSALFVKLSRLENMACYNNAVAMNLPSIVLPRMPL